MDRVRWVRLGGPALVAVLTGSLVVFLLLATSERRVTVVDDSAIVAAVALSVVFTAWRARRSEGRRRQAWALLSVAMACDLVGEGGWWTLEVLLEREVPVVSVLDVFYYLGYVFAIASLLWFLPRAPWLQNMERMLDVLVAGLALLLASWITYLRGWVVGVEADPLELVVTIGYPVMDVAVAAVFLLLVARLEPRRRVAPLLAGTGMLLWVVADVVYAFEALEGVYAGNPFDASWVAGYLTVALAALWVPARPGPPRREPGPHASWRDALDPVRLYVIPLVPVALSAPFALYDLFFLATGDAFEGTFTASLFFLVLARQGVLTLDLRRANREASEARGEVEDLLERGTDIVLRLAGDGTVLYASPAVQRTLGLPPMEVVGRSLPVLLHPEDAARAKALLGGEGVTPVLLRGRVRGGGYRMLETMGSPAEAGTQRVLNMRDVTERLAREAAEAQARQDREEVARLEAVDRLKTGFINAAAHQISTPLTPVILELGLLCKEKQGPLNERQQASLASIERNIHWLQEFSGRLIEAVRVGEGRMRVDYVDADLERLVATAAEAVRDRAEKNQVRLDVRAGPAPGWRADEGSLAKALQQFLENAVSASPPQEEVCLRTDVREEGVVIEVTARGPGLDEAARQRLFQPFGQESPDSTDLGGAAELGLFLAKSAVEAHGGAVQVVSDGTPDGGRTFVLTVPVQEIGFQRPEPR